MYHIYTCINIDIELHIFADTQLQSISDLDSFNHGFRFKIFLFRTEQNQFD